MLINRIHQNLILVTIALYLDDKIGNFEPGKEADFVVLDLHAGQEALSWRQQLTCPDGIPKSVEEVAELLFGVMACGDDRNVAETWVFGEQLYSQDKKG